MKEPEFLWPILKLFQIISWKFYKSICHYLFKTYPLIEECARCEDCGRNVHDFIVPDGLWKAVTGNENGVLCYDCFCDRADRTFHFKRMTIDKVRWD